MKNYFFKLFRKGEPKLPVIEPETIKECSSFSDNVYNQTRGITHILHRYNDDSNSYRYVGDVEIAMSPDPSISSLFSAEHRQILKTQLTNQRRTPAGPQPSDEELLRNGGIRHLERGEIVQATRANSEALNRAIADERMSMQPQQTPTPPSDTNPSNTE